ncbi:MAG: asparagine synthase-related protein [Candidatus Nanopelagicales bacterium]
MRCHDFWGWLSTASDADPVEFLQKALATGRTSGLVGEFAAHLSDGVRAVLVRDPMGVVPLYYGWSATGGLRVDADLRAVRESCWDGTLDHDYAARLFMQAPADPARTVFNGVFQVPPGSIVVLEGTTRRLSRYFDSRRVKRRPMGVAQAKSLLRSAVLAAVSDALASAGGAPVAAHLSGGLDSTMVAAAAQRLLGSQGQALAAGYGWIASDVRSPDGSPDEHDRSIRIGAALGVRMRCVTKADMRAALSDPHLDPLIFLLHTMVQYETVILGWAREAGVTTILSGWGGDEAASAGGTPPFGWMVGQGEFRQAWQQVKAEAAAGGTGEWRVLARAGARPVRSAWRVLRPPATAMDRAWRDVNRSAFRSKRRTFRLLEPPHQRQSRLLHLGHVERRTAAWWLMGRQFGVEYRFPLLDRRVIEVACSLPPPVFRRDGKSRWLFQELLAELVPTQKFVTKAPEPDRVRHHLPEWPPTTDLIHTMYPELADIAAPLDLYWTSARSV